MGKTYLECEASKEMNKETSLQNLIRITLSKLGIVNFRNNTGVLPDKHGRPIRFGLCKGSSDIIGIKPVRITKDMVGQVIGQFVALEVKTKTGKTTEDQEKFLARVKRAGGFACVVRSAGEVEDIFPVQTSNENKDQDFP